MPDPECHVFPLLSKSSLPCARFDFMRTDIYQPLARWTIESELKNAVLPLNSPDGPVIGSASIN